MKVSLNPLNNRGSVKASHCVELNRGLLLGFASVALLGGLTCQKKKKRETEKKFSRQTFTWTHEEKKYS